LAATGKPLPAGLETPAGQVAGMLVLRYSDGVLLLPWALAGACLKACGFSWLAAEWEGAAPDPADSLFAMEASLRYGQAAFLRDPLVFLSGLGGPRRGAVFSRMLAGVLLEEPQLAGLAYLADDPETVLGVLSHAVRRRCEALLAAMRRSLVDPGEKTRWRRQVAWFWQQLFTRLAVQEQRLPLDPGEAEDPDGPAGALAGARIVFRERRLPVVSLLETVAASPNASRLLGKEGRECLAAWLASDPAADAEPLLSRFGKNFREDIVYQAELLAAALRTRSAGARRLAGNEAVRVLYGFLENIMPGEAPPLPLADLPDRLAGLAPWQLLVLFNRLGFEEVCGAYEVLRFHPASPASALQAEERFAAAIGALPSLEQSLLEDTFAEKLNAGRLAGKRVLEQRLKRLGREFARLAALGLVGEGRS
jgi:hypothetical protein